jgi:hypothetical protein
VSTTPDSSSHSHPGTIIGSPTFGASPWSGFGNALSFSDTGDAVNAGPPASGPAAVSGSGDAATFTLEAHIEFATNPGEVQGICGWFDYPTSDEAPPYLYLYDGDLYFETSASVISDTGINAVITTGEHIVAADYDGTTLRLYIDGSVVASTLMAAQLAWTLTDFTIGNNTQLSQPLAGTIDEVRWSNIARYAGSYTPATSPFMSDANTLALYHLDGTSSPPANTGAFFGMM